MPGRYQTGGLRARRSFYSPQSSEQVPCQLPSLTSENGRKALGHADSGRLPFQNSLTLPSLKNASKAVPSESRSSSPSITSILSSKKSQSLPSSSTSESDTLWSGMSSLCVYADGYFPGRTSGLRLCSTFSSTSTLCEMDSGTKYRLFLSFTFRFLTALTSRSCCIFLGPRPDNMAC